MSRLGLLHFAWRTCTAALVLYLSWLTTFVLFPYLDKQMPVYPAIFIMYVLVAYVLIPLVVRFWRIVFKPNHLPRYVLTGDGWPSDPVNIVLVARNRRQLIRTMQQAGWTTADRVTLTSALRLCYAMVVGASYPHAPFSSLYLFGRRQDIGFQIQTGTPPTPRHRHHVRFWQLSETDVKPFSHHHQHVSFWRSLLIGLTSHKHTVWIGAATHDIAPFAIRWRNGQITHQIDEVTERERDFLISALRSVDAIRSEHSVDAGDPLKIRGQTFGVTLIVDDTIKVVRLRAGA